MLEINHPLIVGAACVAVLVAALDGAVRRRDRIWLHLEVVFVALATSTLCALALPRDLDWKSVWVGVLAGAAMVLAVLAIRALRGNVRPHVELGTTPVHCWHGGALRHASARSVIDGLTDDLRDRVMLAAAAVPTTPSWAWRAFVVMDGEIPFLVLHRRTFRGTRLIVRHESLYSAPGSVAVMVVHERGDANEIVRLEQLANVDVERLAAEAFGRAAGEVGSAVKSVRFEAKLDDALWIATCHLGDDGEASDDDSARAALELEASELLRQTGIRLLARQLPMRVRLELANRR